MWSHFEIVGRISNKNIASAFESRNLKLLAKFLESSTSLPIGILVPEWRTLLPTFSHVTSQFLIVARSIETLDEDLIRCGQYALQLTTQMLANIFATDVSDEESMEALDAVLDGFLRVNEDILLVESVVALASTDISNKLLMIETIEKLLHLLIDQTLRLSHHPTSLLSKFFHFLCHSQISEIQNDELSRVVEQITAHYCEQLLEFFLTNKRTEAEMNLSVVLTFQLLEHFGKYYCVNSFKSIDSNQSIDVINLHIDRLEVFLGKFVDLLLGLMKSDLNRHDDHVFNSLYALIGDLYSMLICQRKQVGAESKKELSALDARLDGLSFSVAPATARLGSGWLHFIGIYLGVNCDRYLSLSATNLLVGHVITSIKSHTQHSHAPTERERHYSIQLKQTIQHLFCVVPPQLRERLLAAPLMSFVLNHSVETRTMDSQFTFAIIETLLQIGFCEWKDSKDPNSEYSQNYKKYIVESACWYSEQMVTVTAEKSLEPLFEHVNGASKLYQLQFRALYTSRTLKVTGQITSESDSTKRQYEGTLSTLLYNSIVSFLSLSSSCLLAVLSISYTPEVMPAILSLLRLLIDLLSSSHYPLLNSNSGNVAVLVRQLLLISLMSVTISANHEAGLNVDSLRLMGRVLMVLAANKHIQKHAHLFVGGVIDVLSGYAVVLQSTLQTQHRGHKHTAEITEKMSDLIVTISSHDETLREHLFPGIFALLDRSVTSLPLTFTFPHLFLHTPGAEQ
jgi:hypothetical protein